MTTDPDPVREEGRPIRLTPVVPGFWLLILGAAAMVLGPLFGFLVGTVLGTGRRTFGMSPIFFFLFLGFLVAGLGVGIGLLGARRILRNRPQPEASQPEAAQPEASQPDASQPEGAGAVPVAASTGQVPAVGPPRPPA